MKKAIVLIWMIGSLYRINAQNSSNVEVTNENVKITTGANGKAYYNNKEIATVDQQGNFVVNGLPGNANGVDVYTGNGIKFQAQDTHLNIGESNGGDVSIEAPGGVTINSYGNSLSVKGTSTSKATFTVGEVLMTTANIGIHADDDLTLESSNYAGIYTPYGDITSFVNGVKVNTSKAFAVWSNGFTVNSKDAIINSDNYISLMSKSGISLSGPNIDLAWDIMHFEPSLDFTIQPGTDIFLNPGRKAYYNGKEIATKDDLGNRELTSTSEVLTGETFNGKPVYAKMYVGSLGTHGATSIDMESYSYYGSSTNGGTLVWIDRANSFLGDGSVLDASIRQSGSFTLEINNNSGAAYFIRVKYIKK